MTIARIIVDYIYAELKHRMRNGILDAPWIVLIVAVDELMSEAMIGNLSQLASQGIKYNIHVDVARPAQAGKARELSEVKHEIHEID